VFAVRRFLRWTAPKFKRAGSEREARIRIAAVPRAGAVEKRALHPARLVQIVHVDPAVDSPAPVLERSLVEARVACRGLHLPLALTGSLYRDHVSFAGRLHRRCELDDDVADLMGVAHTSLRGLGRQSR
jgi:hypothetical protein